MHLEILTSLALLSTVSLTQTIDINDSEAARGESAYYSYQTRLATNPTLLRDLSVLASVPTIPTSAISLAIQDPISFYDDLSSNHPVPTSIATAIPTHNLGSLASLFEPHIKADSDRNALATGTLAASLFANSAIPTTVYQSFARDPIAFINELNTASTWPLWATSLPAPLATQIEDVLKEVLSTVRADYEGANDAASTTSAATPTRMISATITGSANSIRNGRSCPTCASSCNPVTVVVTVTANTNSSSSASSKPITTDYLTNSTRAVSMFSSGVMPSSRVSVRVPGRATGAAPVFPHSPTSGRGGSASSGRPSFTGTRPTSSTAAFTGAASPEKKVAVSLATVFAGLGAWMNL